MNWKIGKSRKNQIFSKAECVERTEPARCPARGFYTIYTFFADQRADLEELFWSLTKGETIALVIWDIGAFRDRELDETALSDMGSVLAFFKEHGYDVIFRPVYDRTGQGMEHEPKEFAMVLWHLAQIGQMLGNDSHSVFLFQGLLVGSWGEMHTSAYLGEEYLHSMYACLVPYLAGQISLAVRTPAQWRTLVTEQQFQKNSYTLGLFDDAIFGSGTHLGTFGTALKCAAGWNSSWCRMEELQFEHEICNRVFCGGEVLDADGLTAEHVIAELRQMHVTYLNSAHDKACLNRFQTMILSDEYGIWCGHSLYSYIEAHLGYRFVVCSVREGEKKGGKLRLEIELGNPGFAPLYEEAELFVQMENGDPAKELPVSFDLRTLLPGQTGSIVVWVPQENGRILLCARRKKDHAPILFANEGAGESGAFLGSFTEG